MFKAHACLRINGKGLNPEHISSVLGLSPTQSGVHKEFGSWSRSTKDVLDNTLPLEGHIIHILQEVEGKNEQLHEIQQRYATEIFCFFASDSDLGGFHISADTLARMGSLGLDFDVDEYFCCDTKTMKMST